jgi:hypothetical protein
MLIINNAKSQNRRKFEGIYYELHHILPKSIFPLWKNRKSNKVLLTAKEHYICHLMLDKIYPKSMMFIGLWRLAVDEQNNYINKNSKEYEKLRIRFSNLWKEEMKGAKNGAARKVKNIETGTIYGCLEDAAKSCNGDRRNICSVCTGKRKTHKGYHWEYADDRIFKRNYISKKILCIDTDEIFSSTTDLITKYPNYSISSILNCCYRKTKTANKLHWEFLN